MSLRHLAAIAAVALPAAAIAQEKDDRPVRTRVGLGPQLLPSYPGADNIIVRPLFDFSRVRGDEVFPFEAPDESAGFSLVKTNGFAFGPAVNLEGSRTARDVGAPVRKVGFTVEAGGFVEYQLMPAFRVRGELRQGIGGHKGLIGLVSADYIARDRDRWLFSLGPRVTFSNGRYNRAFFGVSPEDAATTGLPLYRTGGGVQAVGAAAGALYQFTPRWGLMGYAKYDRLVGDPADSPFVRAFGSRNQLSGGAALTYTFGDVSPTP